jgi:hypothetical protein
MDLQSVSLEVRSVTVGTVILGGFWLAVVSGVRVRDRIGKSRKGNRRGLQRAGVNGGVVCLHTSRGFEGFPRLSTVWMRAAETAVVGWDSHHLRGEAAGRLVRGRNWVSRSSLISRGRDTITVETIVGQRRKVRAISVVGVGLMGGSSKHVVKKFIVNSTRCDGSICVTDLTLRSGSSDHVAERPVTGTMRNCDGSICVAERRLRSCSSDHVSERSVARSVRNCDGSISGLIIVISFIGPSLRDVACKQDGENTVKMIEVQTPIDLRLLSTSEVSIVRVNMGRLVI